MSAASRRAAPLTPLVGRTEEIASVRERLQLSRLVSITGPGGIGKTRLALAVAEELDGYVVDLSPITDSSLITTEIAAAVGVAPDQASSIDERVAAALSDVPLLILDNLESVPEPTAVIERILWATPTLRLLVTSRIPVGLAGEAELVLGPLKGPIDNSAEAFAAAPAGRLLLERANAVGSPVELGPEQLSWMQRLCSRLDGIPLALELAANQLRLMTAEDIVRGLEAGTARFFDEKRQLRQRSLEGVLAWSLNQLSAEEFATLCAASITSGGFDLELLRRLTTSPTVVEDLGVLMSLGLVHRSDFEGARRFTVLATIRTAALDRLGPGELGAHSERHALAVLERVRQFGAQLDGPDAGYPKLLLRDRDNIRRALDWAVENNPDAAAELVGRLGSFWFETGMLEEGLEWANRALRSALHSDVWRLHAQATHATLVRRLDPANDSYVHALREAAAQVHDRVASVRAFAYAAIAASVVDDPATHMLLSDALERARQAGLLRWVARLELSLAMVEAIEESGEADRRFRSAIAAASEAGDSHTEAFVLGNYMVFLQPVDIEAAETTGRRAVGLMEDGYPTHLAWILGNLAQISAVRGAPGLGGLELARAIELTLDNPARHLVGTTLGNAAATLSGLGKPELALRAMVQAKVIDDAVGKTRFLAESDLDDNLRRLNREILGDVRAALVERQGQRDDPTGLLREILAALAPGTGSVAPRARLRLRHGELTRREVEVLGLVGQGKTDVEIASALYVSASTAAVHVSNIKSKLGAKNRVEIALKARELGL